MQFSQVLLMELMKAKGFKKQSEMLEIVPKVSKGLLSELVNGKRHLTEEQALVIAHECGFNPEWVLVNLAEEVSKYEEAKQVWHDLAKKISRSASAALLTVLLVFGGFSGNNQSKAVFV